MMHVEFDREGDGRWIAEVPELPGVLAYGQTRDEALGKVETLAVRVLADRIVNSERIPEGAGSFLVRYFSRFPPDDV